MAKKIKRGRTPYRIDWHSAFFEAILAELRKWKRAFGIEREFPLTAKPLLIDVLVIRKEEAAAVDKNFARNFRMFNIIEYKSPGSYVSTADFHKVYAYALLYSVLHKKNLSDISITFVENRYPRKLFAYLKEVWGFTVTETESGIYRVDGDKMAIQVIYRKGLSEKENPWLSGLGADLSAEQCERIARESGEIGGELSAYMHVVLNANPKLVKEMIEMKINPEVTKIVEEAGLLQEWIAEAVANAEAKLKRSEQEREQAVQKQERLMHDVERLKQENAMLKRAARAK